MKKMLSFVMAIIMMVGLAVPCAAEETTTRDRSFERANLEELSDAELLSAIKFAHTSADVDLLFDEYLDRISLLPEDVQKVQFRALADQYLRVNSVSYSGRLMTINYSILSVVPSGASLTLGYEFPAVTRTNGSSIQLMQKAVGTYVQTFNVPNLICSVRASSTFTARNYSDTKVYATYNYTSGKYTDYHTVSTTEAVGYWTVVTLVPGIILTMYPTSALAKLAAKSITVGSAVVSLVNSTNVSIGPPTPQAGQYVETVTWYENNRLYINQRYWSSKAAFNNGDLPIYNSGTYVGANIPTF